MMRHRSRPGRALLKIINAVVLLGVAAIAAVAAKPLIESASHEATVGDLLDNLGSLRYAIQAYKREHDGAVPIMHAGSLPQLVRTTNRDGLPGPLDSKHPFGPYLRGGVPVNTITGRSIVTLTDTFPPAHASGNRGWLYHQPTGQIVPDLDGYLNR